MTLLLHQAKNLSNQETGQLSDIEDQNNKIIRICKLFQETSEKNKHALLSKVYKQIQKAILYRQRIFEQLRTEFMTEISLIDVIVNNSFLEPVFVQFLKNKGVDINLLINNHYKIDYKSVSISKDLLNTSMDNIVSYAARTANLIREEEKIIANMPAIITNFQLQQNTILTIRDNMKFLADTIIHEEEKVSMMMNRRTFFKKSVNIGAKVSLVFMGLAGSISLLAAYLEFEASKLPLRKENALAIIIQDPNNWHEDFGMFFVDIYINRIQLAFGFRAKYVIKGYEGYILQLYKSKAHDSRNKQLAILVRARRYL